MEYICSCPVNKKKPKEKKKDGLVTCSSTIVLELKFIVEMNAKCPPCTCVVCSVMLYT